MRIYSSPLMDDELQTFAHLVDISEAPGDLTGTQKIQICEFLLSLSNQHLETLNDAKVILDWHYMDMICQLPIEIQEQITYVISDEKGLEAVKVSGFKDLALKLSETDHVNVVPPQTSIILIDKNDLLHFKQDLAQLSQAFKVIVTNINSYKELGVIKQLGLKNFSGDFYMKPDNKHVESVSANKANIIHLIAKLNDPKAEFDELSEIIVSDNILSYQLLKIINCPIFRGREEITSIQAAVVRFGLRNLKNWGTTLSLSCYTYKPRALFILSLQRALMCLKLAQFKQLDDPDSFYTAGLLSTLDAFLDSPLEDLLIDAFLPSIIRDGILFHKGVIGDVLNVVTLYQSQKSQVFPEHITSTYIESIKACNEMLNSLNS